MDILRDPIADWWYELDNSALGTPGSAELSYLRQLLIKLEGCLSILRKESLFIPSIVTLSRWIEIFGENKNDLEKEEVSLIIEPEKNRRIIDLIMDSIAAQQDSEGALRPADIELRGWTKICGQGGENVDIFNIISINMQFMSGGIIEISAFGDAWLPYSLDGKIENQAYDNNSALLENSLIEIESFLNVAPIFDKHSEYCQIRRYRLFNFRDALGEILGVDNLGNIL